MAFQIPRNFGCRRLRKQHAKQLASVLCNFHAVGVAKFLGKIIAVADLNHAPVRILAEIVAGKRRRDRHRLAVTWRHEDHQAFRLASDDLLQFRTDEVKMSGSFPSAVMDILDVISIMRPCELSLCGFSYGLNLCRGQVSLFSHYSVSGRASAARLRRSSSLMSLRSTSVSVLSVISCFCDHSPVFRFLLLSQYMIAMTSGGTRFFTVRTFTGFTLPSGLYSRIRSSSVWSKPVQRWKRHFSTLASAASLAQARSLPNSESTFSPFSSVIGFPLASVSYFQRLIVRSET